MQFLSAKIALVFAVAVLLSCVAAWWTAHRYRVAMRRLIQSPAGAAEVAVAEPAAEPPTAPPAWPTLADNRRARQKLVLVLIGVSALMAVTSAAIWLVLSFGSEALVARKIAVFSLVYLWPVFPALALVGRWPKCKLWAALVAWNLLCFAVLLWASTRAQSSSQLLHFLLVTSGVPMVMVALLFMTDAARAVAPWLLLPFVGLIGASEFGVSLLHTLLADGSLWAAWLAGRLSPRGALALFAVTPWLVAWWPLRRLGRAIGHAYARKRLTESLVLFTTVWAVSLLFQALPVATPWSGTALLMFLPLLWIPLVVIIAQRRRSEAGRPPTLLVLRVFQRDKHVQALFDHVVECWRLSGNTVLIAGTDLANRTLDAEDIFTFLDGGLAKRFIRTPAEVGPALAAFDMERDLDGRFRVNECYCHDTTWQLALGGLVQRSDVVLMDLRSYRDHNAGCSYELDVLAQSPRTLRVVVLTDDKSDRDSAKRATVHAPPGRFIWLDTLTIDEQKRDEVLASLFAPT